MQDFSYINNAHPAFIESLYKQYVVDPSSIERSWSDFFKGFDFAQSSQNGHQEPLASTQVSSKEFGVLSLIFAFRHRGHLLSNTNPIRNRKDRKPQLDLTYYGLAESDLDQVFVAGAEIGLESATLKDILAQLQTIYAGPIGYEFAHIENMEKREWLLDQIERRKVQVDFGLSLSKKKRILEKLTDAVVFEEFLQTKYVGQKRFSLEGGETTIAALDAIIQSAASDIVEEVVIGMAHRGRLNVLANTMHKTYEQIFNEFEGNIQPDLSFGDGDVKYHLGYSTQITTEEGKLVHLKLAPNPSHLEAVNAVVEGFARAKADIMYASDFDKILPILIHGDAAMAGQGVVYECVQMSQLDGYYTGGTIHFVINNQIGFTTDWEDARSSTYCTAAASLVQAPVFHVNGDDPEAVVFVSEMAVAFRQKFNTDVFVDMVCYRKHGHNEGDDPKFTQPQMYEIISKHEDPRQIYSQRLIDRGDVEKSLAEEMENNFWQTLQQRLDLVKQKSLPYKYQQPEAAWRKLTKAAGQESFENSPVTGIPNVQFQKILKHLQTIPMNFTPLDKVNRLLLGKKKLLDQGLVDWGYGELAAYASLLINGKDVRMSGQDVRRGTFSHRHAIFRDAVNFEPYNRLSGLAEKQGQFRIYNSLLSEFGVLGFEYGYSMASPETLVIWEAQFGDFYNGAQTIVDQFITAGETKWQRMSGLVMLLPHGYDGQGPEHSSARVERFLQNAAEYNMIVANISTPANFFHLMRRQLTWNFRKPLIVMSPKSLLRHPACLSTFAEFGKDTRFQEILDDPDFAGKSSAKVKKLLLCSGQIYYDLIKTRTELKRKDAAIVRIEQLYPLVESKLDAIIAKYGKAELFWVQEEPANMGAWSYLRVRYPKYPFQLISRKMAASPATGFKKVHDQQLIQLMESAFS